MSKLCKICKSETNAFRNEASGIAFHECPDCEFIFKDAQHIVSAEREKQRYLKHQNSPDDPGYVEFLNKFIATCVVPFRQNLETALDFGCGPSPVLAKLLQEMGLATDVFDKYFALHPLGEKTYDLITATEVLEHLENPLDTLRDLRERLNPNGIVAIMTYFHPGDQTKFLSWWYPMDETHVSFFTHRTFEVLGEIIQMKLLLTANQKYCVFKI